MAIKYYDDLIVAKIKRWLPSNRTVRVLSPDETKRMFETQADDTKDAKLTLPCISLARDTDLKLDLSIKNNQSFDGVRLEQDEAGTKLVNRIPVTVMYQLDIYTKEANEADEYMREFLFKLINNPSIKIEIPYNTGEGDKVYQHIANLRVSDTVSDTSSISERLFPGQFYRWTIQFELQDAALFSVPYKKNWRLYINDNELLPADECSVLELSDTLDMTVAPDDRELLNFNFSPVAIKNN